MKTARNNILNLSRTELKEFVRSLGEPAYRADQILWWVYKKLATSFEEMTDLPLPLRQKLASGISLSNLTSIDEKISADGQTRKVLFRLDDGKTIESGFMLYGREGSSRERRTVCVSTQVGCPIGCAFCATGQQGFERNLNPGEIIEQVLYFMRSMNKDMGTDLARRPVTNVVFMGMGEPLANYEAVWQSIAMLNSKQGLNLGARQITISTVGLVPQIQRLARENIHVELAVSLHAASDELRNRLVPINKKYPLRQLMAACWEYFEKTGRRPTFEYALFRGINDSVGHARELAALLEGLTCHVNLIAGNPTKSKEFVPSPRKTVLAFQKQLTDSGISNTLRLSKGVDIEAGCGQLRSRWIAAR
ncbi:MAG: 23S rRNA (adenine(2503)-C(2))-methyltransferase RlmN [Chloroflexi bacterium]|nr:23S rRNA (adenine(2503)-C(2))-methyltransferase RlmN [Chloroflexota bacterium]